LKTAIIVNPSSSGGRTMTLWGDIRDECRTRLGGLEEHTTACEGDATRIARQLAGTDTELIIVGGGDGTINEVINGLFNEKDKLINPEIKIGILSAGRGCDFIRSVGLPSEFREAMDVLIQPSFKKIDIGCALFKDEFGREQKRYFTNVVTAGLGGQVAKTANSLPKIIPPEIAYFYSVALRFVTSRPQFMNVFVDDVDVFDGACVNVFVANGGYSGAGMCWAPMAKLDDGIFEVIIVEPISKLNIVMSAHKLYDGSFISMAGVHHFSGKNIVIKTGDDIFLEMDGEQPGVAPAAFTLLPQILNIAVP
jgi:diacylglycerol kinase (ATP)